MNDTTAERMSSNVRSIDLILHFFEPVDESNQQHEYQNPEGCEVTNKVVVDRYHRYYYNCRHCGKRDLCNNQYSNMTWYATLAKHLLYSAKCFPTRQHAEQEYAKNIADATGSNTRANVSVSAFMKQERRLYAQQQQQHREPQQKRLRHEQPQQQQQQQCYFVSDAKAAASTNFTPKTTVKETPPDPTTPSTLEAIQYFFRPHRANGDLVPHHFNCNRCGKGPYVGKSIPSKGSKTLWHKNLFSHLYRCIGNKSYTYATVYAEYFRQALLPNTHHRNDWDLVTRNLDMTDTKPRLKHSRIAKERLPVSSSCHGSNGAYFPSSGESGDDEDDDIRVIQHGDVGAIWKSYYGRRKLLPVFIHDPKRATVEQYRDWKRRSVSSVQNGGSKNDVVLAFWYNDNSYFTIELADAFIPWSDAMSDVPNDTNRQLAEADYDRPRQTTLNELERLIEEDDQCLSYRHCKEQHKNKQQQQPSRSVSGNEQLRVDTAQKFQEKEDDTISTTFNNHKSQILHHENPHQQPMKATPTNVDQINQQKSKSMDGAVFVQCDDIRAIHPRTVDDINTEIDRIEKEFTSCKLSPTIPSCDSSTNGNNSSDEPTTPATVDETPYCSRTSSSKGNGGRRFCHCEVWEAARLCCIRERNIALYASDDNTFKYRKLVWFPTQPIPCCTTNSSTATAAVKDMKTMTSSVRLNSNSKDDSNISAAICTTSKNRNHTLNDLLQHLRKSNRNISDDVSSSSCDNIIRDHCNLDGRIPSNDEDDSLDTEKVKMMMSLLKHSFRFNKEDFF